MKAFCSVCGSSLFGNEWPEGDEIAIRFGALDGDPGIRPEFHTFVGSRAPWDELADDGIPDTCVVSWKSTGWTNNRNVTQMLEMMMMMRGEVAIAGREGRERLWDVPERIYPADLVVLRSTRTRGSRGR